MKTKNLLINGYAVRIPVETHYRLSKVATNGKMTVADAISLCLRRAAGMADFKKVKKS